MPGQAYAAVVLAGGGVGDLHTTEKNKVLIPVGGRSMVGRVTDTLKQCPSICAVSLVMNTEEVPDDVRAQVTVVARPGAKMLDSVAAGLAALPTEVAERGCVVIAGDCPFMSIQAVEDFLAEVRQRPAEFYYGYLTRKDSEAAYPGLRHTYARFKEGVLCGTGLIIMTPQVVEQARAVMLATIAARKSPIRITGILGLKFILKFIVGQLRVTDAETRVGELLGCRVAAIQTRHACAAFNVDSADQLILAQTVASQGAG